MEKENNSSDLSTIEFFKESVKNLKTMGTLARSSKYLCKGMIKHVNFEEANVIVEQGAGDGVITKHILNSMKPDAILLTFEVNERFCRKLREIDDERCIVIEDSAENISQYLKEANATHIDYIVSAIPFVALPDEVGYSIISECKKYMKNGGLFIQMHYSLLAKKLYDNIFGNVDVNFVPINVPPAFVLVREKR